MTYPLKPGDSLVRGVCGYCDGPIDLTDLGEHSQIKKQRLTYYRNLEFDEKPFVWKMNKPARFMPFCSPKCSLMHYEKEVLQREDFPSFSSQEIG